MRREIGRYELYIGGVAVMGASRSVSTATGVVAVGPPRGLVPYRADATAPPLADPASARTIGTTPLTTQRGDRYGPPYQPRTREAAPA
jgi:hypothetical protein